MKRRTSQLCLTLLGALVLGAGQGCATTETAGDPVSSEAQPVLHAEAKPEEAKPTTDAFQSKAGDTQDASSSGTKAPEPTTTLPDGGRQLAPAKTLTDIEVQRQAGNVAVVVTGDGDLSYQVLRLDGNRLVVDLPDLINGTNRQIMLVGHSLVRQIRIGSHLQPQQKVRLVLDLTRSVPYTVEKTGTKLRISLSESAIQPGLQEALRPFGDAKAESESPRRSVPIPIPERLRLLDPITALAQPKPGDQNAEAQPAEAEGRFTGKRISLDFQDAEISSVLRLIADVSNLNLVVGESVKAKVTLKLLNVPWDQALELILKLNQLGQIREGNILWIDTLANIAKQRDEITKAQEALVKSEPLVTRIVYLNYADAAKTIDVAKSNLSPRGEIKTDPRTNSLIVRDIEENVGKVAKIVRELDKRTPQVQIEARIVLASKDFSRGVGVQWGVTQITTQGGKQGPINVFLGTSGSTLGSPATTTFLVNRATAVAGGPTAAITIGKFFGTTGTLDLRLSAGESLSLSKTISAPKVITLDNKPAKIESGKQIPFQTTSLQGTQTTFVDASLTLNVTPHVIPFDKTVRLEIKATRNSPSTTTDNPGAGPSIEKKEATTEVLLRDGETTVLGGILDESRTDTSGGIPWFNRIPFLGWLFSSKTLTVTQTELLIFVTPTILKD
jgi:type IV pilus assembly protein PilQ